MRKGWFITFEGGEGAGKSTLIEGIRMALEEKGWPVMVTREPGGVELAERIRNLLLDPHAGGMDGKTETLLYAAARRQHLVEKIIPALSRGEVVLCDRYIDSSLAYQGYARGLGIDEVLEINRFATDALMPHLTLLLDVDPEVGLSRIRAGRGEEMNRLDREDLSFHQSVREGYLQVMGRFSYRIVKIDALKPQKEVLEDALRIISRKLGPMPAP